MAINLNDKFGNEKFLWRPPYPKRVLTRLIGLILKHIIIKPVYKSGDKTNIVNYRPVCLLHSFTKIITVRLTAFFGKKQCFAFEPTWV